MAHCYESWKAQDMNWTVSGGDLLTSSFAPTSERASGDLTWSLWGHGVVTRFDGRDSEFNLEGHVITALLATPEQTAPPLRAG